MKVKKIRIEMNSPGFQAVLTSPEVGALIEQHASRIAAAAGEGFTHETKVGTRHGSPRQVGMVWAETYQASRNEAENKVLTSAIGGG